MKVQLSEKSKAEFVELIGKDSIKCWFDGDEFVMPSGQGKTAKGIVLGKLMVWQDQQGKLEDLEKEWLEMNQDLEKSRQVGFEVEAENRNLQKRISKAKEIADELMQSIENYKLGELLEKVLKGDLDEISKS
ncbi:hypothetical protein [Acinetobacter calcoaceticus]